jgi:hypothetical protein
MLSWCRCSDSPGSNQRRTIPESYFRHIHVNLTATHRLEKNQLVPDVRTRFLDEDS